MFNLKDVPDERLTQTMRGIKAELIQLGVDAVTPYVGSPHFQVKMRSGSYSPVNFSATPYTTSFAAANAANNKYASYSILQSTGVPQLDIITTTESVLEDSTNELAEFLRIHKKTVVKPVSGGHGHGVTIDITTLEAMREAITYAASVGYGDEVLIQQQYEHTEFHDIRILCINFTFIAAIERVPARVFGDGVVNVGELIDQANESPERGEPYKSPLAYINKEVAQRYLGDKIKYIPAINEEVRVLGVANYGAGGELVDVTDETPAWLRKYAEESARTMELPVAGIDFMTSEKLRFSSSEQQLKPALIEINKCPSLAIHDAPTRGKCRGATAEYIRYLVESSGAD